MPNDPVYNKRVKDVFTFAAKTAGFLAGTTAAVFYGYPLGTAIKEGVRWGGILVDSTWVSPDTWQGNVIGSNPALLKSVEIVKTPVVGSAPGVLKPVIGSKPYGKPIGTVPGKGGVVKKRVRVLIDRRGRWHKKIFSK